MFFLLLAICLALALLAPGASAEGAAPYAEWRLEAGVGGNIANHFAADTDISVIAIGARDGYVKVVDEEGGILWDFSDPPAALLEDRSNHAATFVDVSQSGDLVAAAVHDQVRVFSGDGRLLWQRGASGPISEIALTSDGNVIARGADGGVVRFSATGATAITPNRSQFAVTDDGTVLATVEIQENPRNRLKGRVVAVCYEGGRERWRHESDPGESVRTVRIATSGDGRVVAVSADEELAIYRPDGSSAWTHTFPEEIDRIAIDRTGSAVLVSDGSSTTLLAADGSVLWSRPPSLLPWGGPTDAPRSRPGGGVLSQDSDVVLLSNGELVGRDGSVLRRLHDEAWSWAISPDGEHVGAFHFSALSVYETHLAEGDAFTDPGAGAEPAHSVYLNFNAKNDVGAYAPLAAAIVVAIGMIGGGAVLLRRRWRTRSTVPTTPAPLPMPSPGRVGRPAESPPPAPSAPAPPLLEVLLSRLKASDPAERRSALAELDGAFDQGGSEEMKACIETADRMGDPGVLILLEPVVAGHQQSSLAPLLAAAEDTSLGSEIRIASVRLLGTVPHPRARACLDALASGDGDEMVRFWASASLRRLEQAGHERS